MKDKETQAVEEKGLLKILGGLVAKPRATMECLSRARRRWWWVPATLMLVALIFNGVTYSGANAERMYRDQLEWFESMPPEQRGPMAEPPSKVTPPPLTVIMGVAGKVVTTIAVWLVWSGALALASTFFGQNGARFGAFFAMTIWAWIPYVVRNFVQGLYMLLTKQAVYNQGLSGLVLDRAPPSMVSSFRPYIPPARGQEVLAALLTRVDIYLIWNLLLLILGVWAFARLPRKRAVLVTIGIWVIVALLGVLPALVGLNRGFRLF